MGKNVKYRHELKYIVSEEQLAIIKSRIGNLLQVDEHCIDGQYCIRSMYFDNYSNRCYYENENGTDPREKFRIRIYNANSDRISLECKRKEKGRTYKTSCLLTEEQFYTIYNGGPFNDIQNAPDLLRKFIILILTQRYVPVIIVEYDRVPYIYKYGNVRITIDRNVRSSSSFDNFFDKNLPTREILPVGQHLLEVKYDEFIPGFIQESLQLGNLRRSAFSKYYLCRKFSMRGIL